MPATHPQPPFDAGAYLDRERHQPGRHEFVAGEVFRREAHGRFVLYPFGPGERVELAGIDFAAPIEALYEDAGLDGGVVDDGRSGG